jgi:hypothetical protein
LTQRDVEGHHDGKADHGGGGGQVNVAGALGFGDNFLDNDENHRACGEAERTGQQRLGY